MSREIHRWVGTLTRLPLLVLGFVIVNGYNLLFGWWLDKSLARRRQTRLDQDIHDSLRFLFDQHRGCRVPNEGVPFPPGFDYAFVTVAVDNLLLRFCRGRGELDVRVASKNAPDDWHELCLLLNLIEKNEDLQRWGIVDLWQAARLLEPKMDGLKRAFAADPDRDLKQRLADVYASDRIAMREAEWEINKGRS
jgi:hypothetical protein